MYQAHVCCLINFLLPEVNTVLLSRSSGISAGLTRRLAVYLLQTECQQSSIPVQWY